MIWLYYSELSPCFKSIVEVMSKIMTENNIENKITHTLYDNDDLWIVWWPNIEKLPKKCILYNMDPMTPEVTTKIDNLIKENKARSYFGFIDFCYSPVTEQYYKSRGYDYKILPYGISKHQKYIHNTVHKEKDIDILFYGGLNEKRIKVLNDLKRYCDIKGYNIVIRINNLYDENEKANMIDRSKIILSITSEQAKFGQTNDLARLSFVVANKGFIIAEKIGDPMIESLSGINYIELKDLKDTIDHYIINEQERIENVELVYKNFVELFNLDNDLPGILK